MTKSDNQNRNWVGVFTRVAIPCLFLLCFPGGLSGQYLLQTGSPTFTTAEPVEMGFVNVSNGNLHVEIPVTVSPQRGSRGYAAKLIYDSRIWKVDATVWSPKNVTSTNSGWRFVTTGTERVGWSQTTNSCQYTCGPGGQQCTAYWYKYENFFHIDDNGTKRTFPIYMESGNPCHSPDPNLQTPSGWALDGSGYWMSGGAGTVSSVRAPDGTEVYTNSTSYTLKDPNGNFFDKDGSGNVRDTLNRTGAVYEAGGTGSCTGTGVSYCYKILNSQNTDIRIKVKTTKVDVWTNFGQSGVTEYRSAGDATKQVDVITEIILPDSSNYLFGYDSGDVQGKFGLLTSLTVPTDGQITYSYTTFADAQANQQRWVNTRVSGGGTWTYAPTTCGTNCNKVTITRPSGDQSVYTYTLNNGAWNTFVEAFNGAAGGTLLAKTETTFKTDLTDPVRGGAGFVVPERTTTTLPGPSGDLVKKTEYTYDTFQYTYKGVSRTGRRGNLTESQEYAFGSGAAGGLVRKNVLTYLNDCPSGAYCTKNIVNRVTNAQTQNSAGGKVGETKFTYDSTSLTSITGVTKHDDTNFGSSFTTRGNPTLIERWVSGTTYLSTTNTYDTTGQLRQTTDPKGNVSSYSYADSFYHDDGLTPPLAGYSPPAPTNAYLTQVTLPITGSLSYSYYFNTGKQAISKDQNNNANYQHFLNALDRLDHEHMPDAKCLRKKDFSSTQHDIYTAANNVDPHFGCTTDCRHEQLTLDGLGRVTRNSLVDDPELQTYVDTTYDTSGRTLTVTNPYRTSSTGSDTFAYDGLNRVTSVTHADSNIAYTYYGAAVGGAGGRTTQLCATGVGYPTLSVDEAAKKRQTWLDALGRTVEADEPDSSGSLTLGTCYTYDVLGNLTQVVQGSQTRTYAYDGLSRLTAETTPEAGTTNYYFTTSGGALCAGDPKAVCRRTDARSITTTYAYDALNRLTSKTYSDTTPAANFYYDEMSFTLNGTTYTLANTKGRLSHTSAAGGTAITIHSYDQMGHPQDLWQCTPFNCTSATIWNLHYNYDLAGNISSWTHPAGFTITNAISPVHRITQITSSLVDATHPATMATLTYTPWGAINTLLNGAVAGGTQRQETYDYNNRLQPVMIRLGTSASPSANNCLVYNHYTGTAPTSCAAPSQATSGNDGNVLSYFYQDTTNGTLQHKTTYTYDTLNRLGSSIATPVSPGTAAHNLDFSYDRFGNMRCVTDAQTNGPCPNWTFNSATNRINNANFTYDAAGNLTQDGTGVGTHTYQWDAENRLKSVDSGSTATFTYNALGQRVRKQIPGYDTHYVWDASGQELGSYNGTGNYWWNRNLVLNGRSFAIYFSNYVRFLHANHLDTTTVVTDQTGAELQDQLFYPWGQQWTNTGTQEDLHFASLQQIDPDLGLYPTLFRMYSPTQGRWLTSDPIRGTPADPQSSDLYTYVRNNPTNLTDPQGNQFCDPFDPYCNGFLGPYWPFGSITLHFDCPDNRDCCCPYYEKLLLRSKTAYDAAYAVGALAACRRMGSDCLNNCTRACLVNFDAAICSKRFLAFSRQICRVGEHTFCFELCSGIVIGISQLEGRRFPFPYPVDITLTIPVAFRCKYD